jgi:hypothetical protein
MIQKIRIAKLHADTDLYGTSEQAAFAPTESQRYSSMFKGKTTSLDVTHCAAVQAANGSSEADPSLEQREALPHCADLTSLGSDTEPNTELKLMRNALQC